MLLSTTELAVLCVLHDYGAMTEPELSDDVPGGVDLLPRLSDLGYVESLDPGEHQAEGAARVGTHGQGHGPRRG